MLEARGASHLANGGLGVQEESQLLAHLPIIQPTILYFQVNSKRFYKINLSWVREADKVSIIYAWKKTPKISSNQPFFDRDYRIKYDCVYVHNLVF